MVIANEENLSSGVLTDFPSVRRILVIAPHPDDEVFGCGGTLARLKVEGVSITTIIVTDGALGGVPGDDGADDGLNGISGMSDTSDTSDTSGLSSIRAEESRAAARRLGLDAPVFWNLPDRGVRYGEVLIARLMTAIREHRAELVLLPSPADWHPDHQALAFAGAEAVRRLGTEHAADGLQAVFYEVTDLLPNPNLVCDISSVAALKAAAMQCFRSQLQEQPYADRIAGLNCFRAMHLGAAVAQAEAFQRVTVDALSQGLARLLEGSLAQRRMQGYAAGGEDLPLVSVIVRSMDRPTLAEALDSVVLQTWPNIEIVLVNALGPEHQTMPATWGHLPLRIVATGEAIQRTRAANLGLDAARGEYLMFLDDDDWFEANHVGVLVQAIRQQTPRLVAYGGIRCVDGNRLSMPQVFDTPFNLVQLLAGNYIPMHAALFSRTLLEQGCRFDESLEVYEDWDFWIQLARHGDFLHVPGVRAVYRIHDDSGFGIRADTDFVKEATDRIYRKWQNHLDIDVRTKMMFAVFNTPAKDQKIIELESRIDTLLQQQKSPAGDDGLQTRFSEGEQQRIAQLEHQIFEQSNTIHHQAGQIDEILHSTSWKITAPMRGVARWLRGQSAWGGDHARVQAPTPQRAWTRYAKWLYWQLPVRIRTPLLHWAYRNLGRWFRGMPHYEQWRMGQGAPHPLCVHDNTLLLIDTLPLAQQAQGRIAIHLHMYYHDLADEFAGYLRNMPYEYDLYVSVATDEGAAACRNKFSGLAKQIKLEIERVPNRGRDIAPMFCTFGDRLKNYDFIAHLHSKKSLYNQGATEGWRQYLCGTLFGSQERIRRIFELMQAETSRRGMVYPQNYHLLPYAANTWLANRAMGLAWCARLGIRQAPQGYFDFPAGSMFWARVDALQPLFEAGITFEDFAEEAGQTDGTFAHCLERLLVLTSQAQGYEPGIIKDVNTPTWSAWSLHQYVARPLHWPSNALDNPCIKLIAFDIFDTLLCRPLLDAESIKHIVAARHGGPEAALYLQYRAMAEGQARELAGRDVGMNEIYARLGEIAGLSSRALMALRLLEETVETQSVTARPEALMLYRKAWATGKPVVLISDMFLPLAVIEQILKKHGFTERHKIFLSNDIGLRKDSGKLYDEVIARYNIAPGEMIMIGDNERSDLQIPGDKGCLTLHVMRPVDLARGLPRFQKLIDATRQRHDLHDELTLGLVVRQAFAPYSFPQFDPYAFVAVTPWDIGYSIVGPLLTSMAQWLIESARNDRIDRLYFLAREGQLIKEIYDAWCVDLPDTPKTEYLVLSRRAVSVPALKSMDDILEIARATYFPNTIAHFLFERYGLSLSHDRWKEIATRVHWTAQRKVEVIKGQIDHLEPLLTMLQDEIIAQAHDESQALLQYLQQMNLEMPGCQAVVDVGYGGTIQGYLNRLLGQPVQGYYMMTDERSAQLVQQHAVQVRGCFMENVAHANTAPLMYRHNFELEKLLSSSSTQVVRYVLEPGHPPKAQFREKSIEESACVELRKALQAGALRYAQDARDIRTKLYPDFRPSCTTARQIYEAFITGQTAQERALLQTIALDDHYCGREIVC